MNLMVAQGSPRNWKSNLSAMAAETQPNTDTTPTMMSNVLLGAMISLLSQNNSDSLTTRA
ncbi:MAG: hypothetical protein ACK5YQ_15235 [Betaproteobacteria bacterium]|nr:hypothetical protein [Rhodocyclaceae bacterium]